MQVFKLYFKLLKSVAPALFLYAVIFSILIFILSSNQSHNITGFEETKIDTALVNYNEDSLLVRDFLDYLSGYCNFKDYGEDENDLADALFFRRAEYIITIPYDFGEDFLAGKEVAVQKKTLPDGVYTSSVDHAINNYLNTAGIYKNAIPDITEEELISCIRQDINKKAGVFIDAAENKGRDNSFYNQYFNVSSYVMLSCCLLGIGMIMLSFQNVHIRRRNMVTPMTNRNMNLQLMGGNLIFVLAYDILFIIFGFLINEDKSLNGNVLLFWLNMIIFSLSALSISYLAAMLVKSKQAHDAMSYVLPLGLSFISGAFIPQVLLAAPVLKLAGFSPLYWFIKGNDTIAGLVYYNRDNMKDIFAYMLIQLGFAAALFSLSLVVSKNKSQRNN